MVEDDAATQALLHEAAGDGHVELGAEHEAMATHLAHVRQACELLAESRAACDDVLANVLVLHCLDRRASRGRGKCVSAECRAVVARTHEVRHLSAGGDRPHGEAVRDALCHAHDVRLDARELVAEWRATAEEARLHLVHHEEQAALRAFARHCLQVLRGCRPHAALALDALEHDRARRADALWHGVKQVGQGGVVVERHVDEAGGKRLEVPVEDLLARCGKRRERAPVEALPCGDYRAGPTQVGGSPAPRELDGALVCLGAGVREERLPRRARCALNVAMPVARGRQQARQVLGELSAVLDVEVVAHLPQHADLSRERPCDGRVAVAEAYGAYSREAVHVRSACGVHELCPASAHELNGQPSIRAHHVLLVRVHRRGQGLVISFHWCLPPFGTEPWARGMVLLARAPPGARFAWLVLRC